MKKIIVLIALMINCLHSLGQNLKQYYFPLLHMYISLPVGKFKTRVNIADTAHNKCKFVLNDDFVLANSVKRGTENPHNPWEDFFKYNLDYVRNESPFWNDSCLWEYDFQQMKSVDKSETKKIYINENKTPFVYYFYESHDERYEQGYANYVPSDEYKILIFFKNKKRDRLFSLEFEFSKQYREYGQKLAMSTMDSIYFN